MCSFSECRLTFLKLGSASAGLVGVSGIILKSKGGQILAFQCDREFCPVSQSSMHVMINPYIVL